MLHAFKVQAIGTNRKAASASLLLRLGWASGFAIGAYLARPRVATMDAYAMRFSPMMVLHSIWVRDARLIAATQHAWPGFSRRALWAMATSSWAAQFTGIARQMGDEARGVREATALFDPVPGLRRAAPALCRVRSGGNSRVCRRRSACCPIIPRAQGLQRNREWGAALPASTPVLPGTTGAE